MGIFSRNEDEDCGWEKHIQEKSDSKDNSKKASDILEIIMKEIDYDLWKDSFEYFGDFDEDTNVYKDKQRMLKLIEQELRK